VRNILRANVGAGEPPPSIEDIAADLAMSSQTLRRRLRDERSSYRALKAEARREVAIAVLANEGATISDASIAAGFAEANALTRALRNGDGISSSELRQVVRDWTATPQPRTAAR
jgi:AraC-like DNA-binding protein